MTTTTATPSTQTQWTGANRFLNDLLNNSTLTNTYLQICQQANGQENADQILDNWLEQQGYNTTPEMIYTALIAWQNTSLAPWTGIYGQSYFGNNQAAPVLVIGPDVNDIPTPYLNGVPLKNYTFKSVENDGVFNPKLAWGFDSNDSAGEITFYYTSPVTMDSNPPTGYTGNWFKGTLQTNQNTSSQSYYGGLSQINDASDIPQAMNLSAGDDIANFFSKLWQNYKLWVCIVSGVVGCIIIGGLVYYFRNRRRVPERNVEQVNQQVTEIQNDWNLVDQEGNEEQTILYQNNDGILSNHQTEQIPSPREQERRYKYNTEWKMIDHPFISKITGIPQQNIKQAFATMDEDPEMIRAWNELTDEAVAKKYFDQDFNPVDPNNAEYQQWLEKVKTQLKNAQKLDDVEKSDLNPELEKVAIQDLENVQEELIQSEYIDPNDPEYQALEKDAIKDFQNVQEELIQSEEIDPNSPEYQAMKKAELDNLLNQQKQEQWELEQLIKRMNTKDQDLQLNSEEQQKLLDLKQQIANREIEIMKLQGEDPSQIEFRQKVLEKHQQLTEKQLLNPEQFEPPANLKPVEETSFQLNHSQLIKPERPDIKDSQKPGLPSNQKAPEIQPSQSKPITDQKISQMKQDSSGLDPTNNNDSKDIDNNNKQEDPKKEVKKTERPQEVIK